MFVALTHSSGVHAHLRGSWSRAAPGPRFRVSGTEAGSAVAGPMDGQEAPLLAGCAPGTDGDRRGTEPRDAVVTATVLDAARRSATDGAVVRL